MRLAKLEEKNKSYQRDSDEMQFKIRSLEDEKHSLTNKLRDLEFTQQQFDLQIRNAQQKEKGFSNSHV